MCKFYLAMNAYKSHLFSVVVAPAALFLSLLGAVDGLGRTASATKASNNGNVRFSKHGGTLPANAASLTSLHDSSQKGHALGECYGGTCMDKRLNKAVDDLGGFWGRNAGALTVENFISDLAYRESEFNLITILSHQDCAAGKAVVKGILTVPGVPKAINRFPEEIQRITSLMSMLGDASPSEVRKSVPKYGVSLIDDALGRYAKSKSVLDEGLVVNAFADAFVRIVARDNARQIAKVLKDHGRKNFVVVEGMLLNMPDTGFDQMYIDGIFKP